MKLRQLNPFTLIELLIVIGIIGILATVVIPSVGNALQDAKRTAAQVASKTFEEDMLKYDASKGGVIKKYAQSPAINVSATANTDDIQKLLYAFLSGNKDFNASGTIADTTNTSTVESDTHTIPQAAGTYIEPKISIAALEADADGNYPATPASGTGFSVNKFGNPYQFVYRSGANNGTISVKQPFDDSYITLKGIDRGDSKLRVVSFDDSDPARLITKDGVYKVKGATAGAAIPNDSELEKE